MKYFGWKKRSVFVEDFRKGREVIQVIDLYVFNDPELVNHNKYEEDIVRIHPRNLTDYEHWHINKDLEKKESVSLVGIGIHKGCFLVLDEKINLSKLAGRIGIEEEFLESVLSDC